MSASDLLEHALAHGTLDEVLQATLAAFQAQAGTVHLLKDGVLNLAASQNIPVQVAQLVQTVPVGKGLAGLAAERFEPVSLCNLQTDTSGQARPAARMTGMEGSVAVPMIVNGSLRGVLGIAKAAAYDWSDAEKERLLEIASQAAELHSKAAD